MVEFLVVCREAMVPWPTVYQGPQVGKAGPEFFGQEGKEMGMRKWFVFAGALLLCAMVGCGGDNREQWLIEALKTLSTARDEVRQIKKNVEDEVAKAKDKKELSADQFKAAFAVTEELKKRGATLLDIKRNIDAPKNKITQEEREQFAQKYRGELQQMINDLTAEQKALDEALRKAEEINPQAVADLKKKLREAQGMFELVAKQR